LGLPPTNMGLRVLGSNWIFTFELVGAVLLWFVLISVTLLDNLDRVLISRYTSIYQVEC